jgi:dolichol-phosphate mannosyltransferase
MELPWAPRLTAPIKWGDIRSSLPRYVAVGGAGVLLGTAVLWFLTDRVHLFYLASASLAALGVVISDFLLNNTWTFANRRSTKKLSLKRRLTKHITSKAVGFVISFIVLAFFTQVIGLHYLFSNLFAICASFTWNYTASSRWVWAKEREQEA